MSPLRHAVSAVMMVRNEQHIIAYSIGHMLTALGIDRVYVVDNGSADRTPDILRRISLHTGRVIFDSYPGQFCQAEVLTALAHRAELEGADWVLPADADEFLWLAPGVSLATLCGNSDVGGYRIPVCNFLQASPVRSDWHGSLLTMCVAAVPSGLTTEAQARVCSGEIPFVRMAYPNKLLLRATQSLQISFGNHDAENTRGPLIAMTNGEILHAPIRAASRLHQRAETGRRVESVTRDPGYGWHVKRVAAMDRLALKHEWRRNSFMPFMPLQKGAARRDWRLFRIAWQQRAFSRRFAY